MASPTSPPQGVVEVRYVGSRSVPGKRYRMFRTRGGWQHADLGCFVWQQEGRCRHMDELNEEGAARPLPTIIHGDPLARVEELEDKHIMEVLSGKVDDTWVYHFPMKGQGQKEVWGLSVIGVQQAAREMAKRGEVLREVETRLVYEDEREARFICRAERVAVSANGLEVHLDMQTRAKRQPKYITLRDGGEAADPHWYEKGHSKAVRNAFCALLSDEVRQYIIEQAKALPARIEEVPDNGPKRNPAPRPKPAEKRESEQPSAENGEVQHSTMMAVGKRFAGDQGALRSFVERHAPNTWGATGWAWRLLTPEQCAAMRAALEKPD